LFAIFKKPLSTRFFSRKRAARALNPNSPSTSFKAIVSLLWRQRPKDRGFVLRALASRFFRSVLHVLERVQHPQNEVFNPRCYIGLRAAKIIIVVFAPAYRVIVASQIVRNESKVLGQYRHLA
jgi:hypothetical protein